MKNILCVLLVCFMLSGCAYYKNTLFQIKAETIDIETTIPEIPRLKGENISATLNRGVYLGSHKTIPDLPNVKIKEKTDKTDASIEITKPEN